MRRFSIAVIQMASGQDPEENLQALSAFVREAARRGASAAALPESVSYRGVEMERYAEEVPGGPTFQRLSALARETGMWLHGGSIYEKNPQGGRPYNCTMVIRPDGTLAAKYRKLHPFDVTVPEGGQMRESSQICPGDAIVTVDAGELGTWGLSVCYDLRFGELYRIMALEGAQVLFVPANFTLNTGKDHWEVLLRARAIENGCYVVAPEQFGPPTAAPWWWTPGATWWPRPPTAPASSWRTSTWTMWRRSAGRWGPCPTAAPTGTAWSGCEGTHPPLRDRSSPRSPTWTLPSFRET